jgi:hypothetical protein
MERAFNNSADIEILGYRENVCIGEKEDARVRICHCDIDILIYHQGKEISSN